MSLMQVEEPEPVPRSGGLFGHPVWNLGFRPFYLASALLAALAVPLWLARYYGWLPVLAKVDLAWHMHEMIFGMAIAVVVGFLFTAGRNWTGLWTPVRGHLAALVALWLAGRVALLTVGGTVGALVDLLFLPCAIWPLWQVMRRSKNSRNYMFVVLLSLLTLANALYHAVWLGWLSLPLMAPAHGAILMIVLIESLIGTRVIPMFTRNGAPGTVPKVVPTLDKVSVGLLVASALAWVAALPGWLVAPLCVAAGVVLLYRLAGWQPQRTVRVPLLWVLHLSYGWIGVGFILLALAALGMVSASAAFHALTVGSMAGLIIGMMTRTSLGHTGRPLLAGRTEFWMYAAIQVGAVARVLASLLTQPELREGLMVLATVGWTLAFWLFLAKYARYLGQPRIDGKEG
ncbi:NnrS family protein [Massilia sp. YIM B04103]|uniref:NnrS family protein n=1 Tax=Massilia sp. YIM B04103 TaxID=2963106 RepID=UPI0021097250|nr:NnrS family protein [Massilia sp. YIM B04103]